jgi:nucleoside-diphosphate-sugar epimerase
VTKIKAEDAVHEIGVARGLSYTIIRPGMIYGPRSGMWTDFAFKFAQMKPLLWVGDGSGSMFPIHVEDVADLIALVAIHPAAHNEIFNCVGQVTWRKYLMQHAQLVDNNTFIGVPVPLVYMAARLISLIGRGAVRSVYEQAHAITRHATIDMRKARDLLGWQPKYTLEQGMETVIPYLREKGWLN